MLPLNRKLFSAQKFAFLLCFILAVSVPGVGAAQEGATLSLRS